ncbi:MAG: hypothetical protein ACI4DY_09965 [Monoglobaceae bacterium]
MRKLLIVLLIIFAITLTGCHAADPPQMNTDSVSDISSAKDVQDTHSDLPEAESSSASAVHDESESSLVAAESKPAETSVPSQNTEPTAPENISSGTTASRSEEKPHAETTPVKPKPEPEKPVPDTPEPVPVEPNATAADSSKIADLVIKYINDYRTAQGVPTAARLPGLTGYAEYRSRQLISNFAHDTDDERAAATALQYGDYIDPALFGITGDPYYTVNAREAIAKGGYSGTVDDVAKSLAQLVKNSAGHWSYVGSSEYEYIAVGVTYRSGMWYCDIAMARENTDKSK